MPLINMVRPFGADFPARVCRPDRIIADFGMTLRVRINAGAKLACHHLRSQADSQVRFFVAQRHADPVDLPLYKFLAVVGALRPAENRRTSMLLHRLRQRIAKSGPADIERIAELCQRLADAAGRGVLLMQDEKNGLHVIRAIKRTLTTSCSFGVCKYDRRKAAMPPARTCACFAGNQRPPERCGAESVVSTR